MKHKIFVILFLFLLSPTVLSEDIDSDWYEPGVNITQPDVWSNSGIMVTDTLGRPAPTTRSQPCTLVRQCFTNGNCVLRQVCD